VAGGGYGGLVTLARAERAALSDTLARTDPDQPTLCVGWTARDLLAHLLVRERQPWAAGGIVIPFLAPLTERAMQGYADTAWEDMVEQLRSGPPAWSPSRIGRIDEATNGAELFVHHEDVRRGRPGWEPRGADETRDGALWELVTRMGRLFYRRSPVGVTVRRPTGEQAVIKTGRGLVTIEGEPGEILLHAFGRDAVRVELRGQPADVGALAGSARGA
jgi:uncharacterized protein (TIGR03085 family)